MFLSTACFVSSKTLLIYNSFGHVSVVWERNTNNDIASMGNGAWHFDVSSETQLILRAGSVD
jgi:hypothetical protein